MATKGPRRSAFAVYQQLKQEQEQVEDDVTEPTSGVLDSSGSPRDQQDKGSRKRKREVVSKIKKRRRLANDSDEEIDAKKSRKFKSGKVKKLASEKLTSKKKKKSIVSTRSKPTRERTGHSSSGSEQQVSTGNDDVDNECDYEMKGSVDNESEDGVPFRDQFEPDSFEDSRVAARELFGLVINPVSVDQFYNEIWEKKPLLIHRHRENYNTGWFSTQELDSILRENDIEFGTNIDLTSYEDGKRETHNPDGRAHASMVWEYFQSGCSVRLLNPATYSESIRLLNSTLQEHFNSCVGANIYLTPAGSQGFAPHYDDIEAFVLQLEGRKHWRVYAPRNSQEMFPQYSSANFSEDDELGHPVVDTVLEPGDILYFPRGFIHQANTLPDSHSLHVTVSTYQKNTWGNLLEKLLPAALQIATTEDVDFRRGLPVDCLNYMGVVNSDSGDARRMAFCEKISELMSRLIDFAPVDSAIDQVAADHIHSSLPPVLTQEEKQSTCAGLGSGWAGDSVEDGITLTPDCKVKLVRYGAARLVMDGDDTTLYYTLQNSKIYQEKDLIGMQIHQDDAPAVDSLINAYPEFTKISDLPMQDGTDDDKVSLCDNLYSQGLLVIDT